MGERVRIAAVLLGAFVVLPTAFAAAGADKELQNVRGTVTYGAPGVAARPLAFSASVVLSDKNIASTGNASLGALSLPDSSRILLGQNTRIQLGFFDQTDVATAKFIIYNGKTRFSVQHPQGEKANYIFDTPTAQIAVRGTDGDISVDTADGMRLNVYHLGDANLPVTAITIYGEKFTLHGGQKLWVRWQNGRIVGRQTKLSKTEINRFAEFGPPNTIDGGSP